MEVMVSRHSGTPSAVHSWTRSRLGVKGQVHPNSSFERILSLTVDVLPELREERTDVFDEHVDERADRSILQRDDCNRPWPDRQVDRERLDPLLLAVEVQRQATRCRNEFTCSAKAILQR